MRAVFVLGSPKAKGNTATIISEIARALEANNIQTSLHHLSELKIEYCCGCKSCDKTGKCVQNDDVQKIIEDIFDSQLVIVASPSYWGDVTGQMKVFIDRCTPYSDTNPIRATAASAPKGAAVAVRAGGSKGENLNLVNTIEHFLGHLDIPLASHFTVEGIDSADDLMQRPKVLIDAYSFGEKISKLL